MVFMRFKDFKIVERWEILDLLSMVKQLFPRQQVTGLKNANYDLQKSKQTKNSNQK